MSGQIEDGSCQNGSKTQTLGSSQSTSDKSSDSAPNISSVEGSGVPALVPCNGILGQKDLGVVVRAAQNSLDKNTFIRGYARFSNNAIPLYSFRLSPADVCTLPYFNQCQFSTLLA